MFFVSYYFIKQTITLLVALAAVAIAEATAGDCQSWCDVDKHTGEPCTNPNTCSGCTWCPPTPAPTQTCILKNDYPSPLEVNNAMQAFCPLYATGVGVKGKPKYGGSAEMCKQKDQKYETRLHQAMFHGMFGGASSSGRDCGAWCLFDLEEPNRHFRWDNKKGCWKTRKNRPCKDSTNEERGFAADIFDSFCA